eukprot:SRR837773.11768.p2 GENE.SRR837773.11768~~SRR837773.11768.p2  ORF type:complete len:232 (+),score=20.39 SRR837773.11768:392-1087(+)
MDPPAFAKSRDVQGPSILPGSQLAEGKQVRRVHCALRNSPADGGLLALPAAHVESRIWHLDVIVLQDHSALPTIERARREMYYPAIMEFSDAAKRLHKKARRRKPLIALYMTWSYMNGGTKPGRGKAGCWVKRQSTLAHQSRGGYLHKIQSSPCQGYALASAAASGLRFGGDVLIPAGLAWQVARGSEPIPRACKAAIDDEYAGVPQLGALELPLQTSDPSAVRWRGCSGP